jgi:hypothetical protein
MELRMENNDETALPITPKVRTQGPDFKELVEVSVEPTKELASTSLLEERFANWGSD